MEQVHVRWGRGGSWELEGGVLGAGARAKRSRKKCPKAARGNQPHRTLTNKVGKDPKWIAPTLQHNELARERFAKTQKLPGGSWDRVLMQLVIPARGRGPRGGGQARGK